MITTPGSATLNQNLVVLVPALSVLWFASTYAMTLWYDHYLVALSFTRIRLTFAVTPAR